MNAGKTHKITDWIQPYQRKTKGKVQQVRGHYKGVWKGFKRFVSDKSTLEWLKEEEVTPKEIIELNDFSGFTFDGVKKLLEHENINYKEVNFNEDKDFLVYETDGTKYIVDRKNLDAKDLDSWFWGLGDWEIDELAKIEPFNYWESIGNQGNMVYHATDENNITGIFKDGLKPSSETRAISNRFSPAAVFTSIDTDISAYGDKIIAIDTSAMKRDGYMPDAQLEDPISESDKRSSIAHKVGFDEYYPDHSTEGINENTVMFVGNIPPKYLKVIK